MLRAQTNLEFTGRRPAVPSGVLRPASVGFLLGFLLATALPAQTPLSNLVVTVGTTIQDTNAVNWSYVLLGAPQPQLLAGKHFAVYGKAGFPTNAGSFTLRGTIFQQTDPNAVSALLNQSLSLGEDLNGLNSALNTLLHKVPGATNLPLPQKVLTAFQVAATDPATGQMLGLLAHVNPGLTLCAGQAFSEPIAGVTTYEAREVSLATGLTGEVVGRVTITPGSPTILPPPGYPFQVITNDPSDHLRIRLRWGTSPALRRLSLLGFGFNIWRIPLTNALALGYNTNPPSILQLQGGAFNRVNQGPVIATKDFDVGHGIGSADDPTDRITYFFSDNNGHALGSVHFPSNSPPHFGYLTPPFNDGDEFYYFITARDVLGRDGHVSPGGQGEACRRLRAPAPANVRVQNVFHVTVSGGATNNQQSLQVSWQQDTNTSDQVSEYWVYRWTNPSMALSNDIAPYNNRIHVVPQAPGTNVNYYLDNGTNAPNTPGLSNYWYTVRAVSQAFCDPLLSPQSMPAWGVLRERFGPPGTTGQIVGSCGTPAVIFQTFNNLTNPGPSDIVHWNYRFTCQRRDPGIAWVQFFATNQYGGVQTFGPLYFPPDGNTLSADYSPIISGTNDLAAVTCLVGSFYGLVSQPATAFFSAPPLSTVRLETVFYTGELLLTALSSQDPLLAAVGGGQRCLPALGPKAYPDGTVCMGFDTGGGIPLLIQASTNSNPDAGPIWFDVAVVTPGSDGRYCVYYPACLLEPLPRFRGCSVNLPGEGNCIQHVSSGPSGGKIAPILIIFYLTPRTHEYRLYRSINNGPLQLIAQGSAIYDPSDPFRTIVRTDDVMPPSAARICYYVQLLDEHGNGSPMTLLGCKEVKPAKLPRPVLAEPQPAGDANNPQVALTWFCPTSGVYRFQLNIQRQDHPGGGLPSGIVAQKLTLLPFFNSLATYYGLLEDLSLLAHFDEAQVTPPIGPKFGPGPNFTITANVLPSVPYHIAVAAMDNQGNVGDASQIWTFTWTPTNPLPTVPWPARPLPPINDFDDVPPPLQPAFLPRVAAVLLRNPNLQLDQQYPVGIRIGDIRQIFPTPENIGTANFLSYQVVVPSGTFYIPPPPTVDPNNLIFQRVSTDPSRNGQPLLPIVVYREQIANAAFPQVSGTLTQVTPLIERLPYADTPCTNCPAATTIVTIYDRLIAGGSENEADYTWDFLYVRDQQPVMLGASYRYFVVRFNGQREISEVIPAGVVAIPASVP